MVKERDRVCVDCGATAFAAAQLGKDREVDGVEQLRIGNVVHDVAKGLAVVLTNGRRHHLVWTFAHVLIDGWSAARLMGDLLHLYSGEQLAPPRCRYRDYVAWIAGRDHSAAREYWTAQLQKLDEPTRLLDSWSSPRSTEPAEHVHVLTQELTRRLEQCARQERVTLNTLMQAAWALLLSRCTGRGTVVFGSKVPISLIACSMVDFPTPFGPAITITRGTDVASARRTERRFSMRKLLNAIYM